MFDMYTERKRKQLFGSRRRTLKTFSIAATVCLVGLIGLLLCVVILFAWYAKDLPRPDKVQRSEGLSTVILDRNGIDLYDIFQDENRIPASWDEVPKYLREATVAVEDKDFYKHSGLSTSGMIRATINIFVFHNFQGGSTLTQQLVKTVLLTQERTLPRKIKEAILAVQIERKYTKDEILLMYLNEVPYGGTAAGVVSAAKQYFGKSVSDLGLVECAFLAGLPQSPSQYSPFTGTGKLYIWRTQQVLRRMREDGYISPTQEQDANKQLNNIVFTDTKSGGLRAPHFVEYVKEQLVKQFGASTVEKGGLKVTTTLDWKLQEQAQKIVAEEIAKVKYLKVSNGAVVVLDPKGGEILSMVGSKDYMATDSGGYKFNVATQGLRQPGSTIKPFSYATAFKKGYTASTVLMDVDTKYPSGEPTKPEYNPKNYDGKFRGPMQLRYALGNSINTIAVKVTALVGIKDVLKTAYDMGLNTLEPTDDNMKKFGLSITLGGGEVTLLDITNGFASFANTGLKVDPISILKVEDAKGTILFEQKPQNPKRVLSDNIAFIISNILADNDARKDTFGINSSLVIPGKTVSVKTGTTDDKRDNWTIGYAKSRVVGVWVGNNDNSPMDPRLASGITGAAPIWNRVMKIVLEEIPNEPLIKPDSVTQTEIDGYGGGIPIDGSAKRNEYYIKGTEPNTESPVYQKIKVSKHDNNKLANSVEVTKGEYDTKTYVIFNEKDPISTDGKNRWQEAIDAWVASQGDAKFHPPKDTYEGGDNVSVSIKSPSDMARINSNSVEVKGNAATLNDFSKIEFSVDDSKIKEINSKDFDETISISNGSHIIKIRAYDNKGNSNVAEIHVGINIDYVTPTPQPSPSPTP
jgi:1A family penicillin-binding protein